MWNLTNGTRTMSPHHWQNHPLNAYKEMSESLIVMPDRLPESPAIEIYRARAVIPAVTSTAPKHPKKRFLEAATAQLQLEQPQKKEDNSALMQLAEMCVYYQKANVPPRPCEGPFEPPVYSISMSTKLQQMSAASPKAAATPFSWGWSGSESRSEPDAVDENEGPLDLSGEETFRTNQQELIDCLVEKLCARPVSVKFSSLVQQKLSLLETPSSLKKESPVDSTSNPLLNSSSEVSSSVTDQKDADESKSIRRDLPLKKRESSCLFNLPDISSTSSESSSSSSSVNGDSIVSSTNNSQSKKPAPRSCKGKRYLEFMYEGRFTLTSTRVRRRSESNEMAETLPLPRKRQRRQANEPGKTLNLRGRPKLRKVS